MKKRHLLFILAFLSIVGWGPFSFLTFNPSISSSRWLDNETKIITAQANNLNIDALKLSLAAYQKARQQGLDDKQLLTIVDYSKPSTERRLWVVDIKNQKVLFNTWVAHGRNSGDNYSNSFSNQASSLKSSLGVFLTEDIYSGHNGISLRLQGLERGINDNALKRTIVVHGADYANPETAKHIGRLGRSWGCLAVGRDVINPLINTIRDHTLIVAYYPDRNWIKTSSYLNSTTLM